MFSKPRKVALVSLLNVVQIQTVVKNGASASRSNTWVFKGFQTRWYWTFSLLHRSKRWPLDGLRLLQGLNLRLLQLINIKLLHYWLDLCRTWTWTLCIESFLLSMETVPLSLLWRMFLWESQTPHSDFCAALIWDYFLKYLAVHLQRALFPLKPCSDTMRMETWKLYPALL